MERILVIGMSPIVGGVNTYILNVFMHLNDKYRFEFINTYDKPLVGSKLIKLNGGIIRNINMPQSYFRYFIRYHVAKAFFKHHHKYNVVYVNTSTINKIFWIKAAKKYGINRCIIHSHIDSSNKPKWFKLLSKYLVMYNQHYLRTHNNIIKLAASNKCGRWMFGTNNSFIVINNGVNTQQFNFNRIYRDTIRKKLGINLHSKVIISTSRLEPVKNYSKIINVFNHIHQYIPLSVLIILGTGSKYKEINNMVKNKHLNKCVYFLGNKNRVDIPKYLSCADLMLMPSLYEGLPFSLIEAQSCGVPALVSKGIPLKANVTGCVYYLSIKMTNNKWAYKAIELLHNHYNKDHMNSIVRHSKFNVNKTINEIDKLI